VTVERGADQTELPRVATGLCLTELRMRILAVQRRVGIGPSGHHQTVEPTDDVDRLRLTRHLYGQSADGGDAFRILAEVDVDLLALQRVLGKVRHAGDGPSTTGQADQRPP